MDETSEHAGDACPAASHNVNPFRGPSVAHARNNHGASNCLQLTAGVMGLFTGPHQISFSELGSRTIRLSRGERPVFAPEYAVKAPVDVMAEPVS
jgi:hypothetical protein